MNILNSSVFITELLLIPMLLIGFGACGEETTPVPAPTQADLQRWIKDLGNEDFAVRNTAHKALEEAGLLAEPMLKAAVQDGEPEVRSRAQILLDRIEFIQAVRRVTVNWPGGTYEYRKGGAAVGKVWFENAMSQHERSDVVRCTTHFELEDRGQKLRFRVVELCALDPYLTPLKTSIQPEGQKDDLKRADLTFKDDTVTGTLGNNRIEKELPAPFLTEFTLMRAVTVMPFKEGAELAFNSFESTELNLKRGHKLVCVGKEMIKIDGTFHTAWKFAQHTDDSDPRHFYWVSEARVLLKALIDNRKEIVLVDLNGRPAQE